MNEAKMSFTAHLEELRSRLIICLIAVGIGFVGSYFFKEKLFHILVMPLLKAMGEKNEQNQMQLTLTRRLFRKGAYWPKPERTKMNRVIRMQSPLR